MVNFPGFKVACAIHIAQTDWHNKVIDLSRKLTDSIEKTGPIPAKDLYALVKTTNETFLLSLLQQLHRQGLVK